MNQTYINRMNKNISVSNIDECIDVLYIKYSNDILITKILSEIEYIIYEFNTSDVVTNDMIKKYKHVLKLFLKMNNIKYFNEDYIILYTYLTFYSNIILHMKDGENNILKNRVFELPEVINNVYINRYINLNIENIVLESIRKNFNNNINVQDLIYSLRSDQEFNINIKNYIHDIIKNDNNIIDQLISRIPIDIIIKNKEFIDKLTNYIKNYISDDKLVNIISKNPLFLNNIKEYINENIKINNIINKIVTNDDFLYFINNYNKNYDFINLFKNNEDFIIFLKNIINNDYINNILSSDEYKNIIDMEIIKSKNIDIIMDYVEKNSDVIKKLKQKISDDEYLSNLILSNENFLKKIKDIISSENIDIDSLINSLNINEKFKNILKEIINKEFLKGNDIMDLVNNFNDYKQYKKSIDEKIDDINIKQDEINTHLSSLDVLISPYQNLRTYMNDIDTMIESIYDKYDKQILNLYQETEKLHDHYKQNVNSRFRQLSDVSNSIDEKYDNFIKNQSAIINKINDKESYFYNYVEDISKNIKLTNDDLLIKFNNIIENLNSGDVTNLIDIKNIDLSEDIKIFINKILPELIKNFLNGEYVNSDKFKNIINESVINNINTDYILNIIKSNIPTENSIITKVESRLKNYIDDKFYDINNSISLINTDISTNNAKISEIAADIEKIKNNISENIKTIPIEDFNDEKAKIDKILKYLEINPVLLQSKYANIKEYIKSYTSRASLQIKNIIINILDKILSDNKINIEELSNFDSLDDKILKSIDLLKLNQLDEIKELLSKTKTEISSEFDEKINAINELLLPLLESKNENIAGIYDEINIISNKYNEILTKIDNMNYLQLEEKIENVLDNINYDFINVIDTIKNNLKEINDFIYKNYSQGNIPKYITETENTLRGYAETLNKIIIYINSLENAPRINTFSVPKTNVSKKSKSTNVDVANLIKYNNMYEKKRNPLRQAGFVQEYKNPILNVIYNDFLNKYINKINNTFNIKILNNSYKKILFEYDNNSNSINDIIKNIYTYKTEDISYYISIKKYINILNYNKKNVLFSLFKRYVKYGYLMLKFRIILNNNNNTNDIVLYFIKKIITNIIKYNVIYDYIESSYDLLINDTKCNLINLSHNILLDYIHTLFLYKCYNKNFLYDKNIFYIHYNNNVNDYINIDKLYCINYLELSVIDKKYYKYLLNFKNKIFEEHIKYFIYNDNSIKENINYMIDKHIIINNNIKNKFNLTNN
ncbi:hypothetical protein AMV156 [Betaentomopoxvirus amoorei]|uniref:AMV156 n=1 Tax=Amsacta moorei entomopoxvirus TaxID=28321 RepID=Q9EMP3_AMEPV|nr:hypothetical protein AMV156 [Amsacta moorei entomopoxvirus]AAG02862.1 AMV156 [Amsacta moorei entomopoxvirus]